MVWATNSIPMNESQNEIDSLKSQVDFLQKENAELRESVIEEKRKFEQILDGLPAFIWIKDDRNNIVYLNQAAASTRGLTREQMEGRSTYEFYPDTASKYFKDDLEVISSGKRVTGIVEQVPVANGEKRWVQTSKHPWLDKNGKAIGVLVAASDISEMVRLQDQRDHLMAEVVKQLESSEERYYLAIRGSNDGVWDWNLLSDEVFYSPRYKELIGYRDDEFPNKFSSFAEHVHPDDLPEVMKSVRMHLEEKLPYEVEFRMRNKAGAWSWFSARGQAIWDDDGKPYRMAGSQRDITDRKQAEQNVNEFFSTVSHELRTPLSAVKGSLRLIEGGLAGKISKEARELLDIALSSCERLIRLVNDILDLRKIEAGKVELRFRKVNSVELIDDVLQQLSSYADAHGIVLSHENQKPIILDADRDRLVQVLTNLVGNSIKFSRKGCRVAVSARQSSAGTAVFSVEDNGPGIPKSQQHLLFMKFKQLDASDSRKQEGTGLGLAICKAIVRQHQGKIGIESDEGKGAKFWFELPLKTGKVS